MLKNVKYNDLLKLNKEMEDKLDSTIYEVTVLSNTIVNQSKEIMEYVLRNEGINAKVKFGDYDNIIQGSQQHKNSNAIIIFWELSNITDGFQYKVELMNEKQFDDILKKTKSEIDLVLDNLGKTSLVIFNTFTSLFFSTFEKKKFDKLSDNLNRYLEEKKSAKFKIVDINTIVALVGISNSIDFRYYHSSKVLYTVDFFKAHAEFVKPLILATNGKSKKALIFDCDNTLWKGIIGEDGLDSIEMSSGSKNGAIFSEIQAIALALNKQGVLIGLCSKNNSDDINEIISSHPDMQLREKFITIKKVNWEDKVSNLVEISNELNIGLDSMVFVDDSSFEVNFIRKQLPDVTVLQVPEKLYEYPKMLRDNLGLFCNLSFTEEDTKKNEMYKQQAERKTNKKKFTNIEDYLASLKLKITIFHNDETIIPRMSQMSQKTNQFNLTTKRYTESDIQNFINDSNSNVFAFSLSDKLGDSGVTGLCILIGNVNPKTVEIDTLLMSCRIIGRNVEYVFMNYVIEKVRELPIKNIISKYIKTPKNGQVKEFYDKCSFDLINKSSAEKNYSLDLEYFKPKRINYIEVLDGESIRKKN